MRLDDFSFGGFRASEYGIKMREPFTLAGASASFAYNKKILGRNGNLVEWDGSYANRKGTAKCSILDLDACEKFDDFVAGLFESPGYKKLEVDSIPGVYMMAMVETGPQNAFKRKLLNAFEITFTCKPQKFLPEGEETITLTESGTINNPTNCTALPLITVYGSGSGKISVAGTTVDILSIEDQITLDCDLMDAYKQTGDAAFENKNSCISAPEFPELTAGANPVSFSGGITKIEIVPRWWKL